MITASIEWYNQFNVKSKIRIFGNGRWPERIRSMIYGFKGVSHLLHLRETIFSAKIWRYLTPKSAYGANDCRCQMGDPGMDDFQMQTKTYCTPMGRQKPAVKHLVVSSSVLIKNLVVGYWGNVGSLSCFSTLVYISGLGSRGQLNFSATATAMPATTTATSRWA